MVVINNNKNKIQYKFGLFQVLCFIQQLLLQQLDMEILHQRVLQAKLQQWYDKL